MISFESDYNNGAHPKVLQKLVETNGEQTLTYGFDRYSERAKQRIREACDAPDADIFLLVGGTQTNTTVIDGMIQGFEAVVCCQTGHINVHEAGAVELSGHKVIGLPQHDGKLAAADLEHFMLTYEADESRDHVAQPALVYISFPTELGTLYTAREMEQLYDTCARHGLKLFIDGARLGYGLAASADGVTLPWLCRHCDALYIGGTKVGALCGEAVVFPRHGAPRRFFSLVKAHGALLAKGRLTGIQFDALFEKNDDANGEPLYLSIARHAIRMAMKLKALLKAKGYPFFIDSPTNQQFVVLPNHEVERLEQRVQFTHWERVDEGHMACRFVTSWATTDADLHTLEEIL